MRTDKKDLIIDLLDAQAMASGMTLDGSLCGGTRHSMCLGEMPDAVVDDTIVKTKDAARCVLPFGLLAAVFDGPV